MLRAGAGRAFLCIFGVFPSPVSITRSQAESRNHPSWIPEPPQAPIMGWLKVFHGNYSSTESFFLTKPLCGHIHVLSKVVFFFFLVEMPNT